jgi:hypothetical protein
MQRHSRHSKNVQIKNVWLAFVFIGLSVGQFVPWTIGSLDSSPNVLIQNTVLIKLPRHLTPLLAISKAIAKRRTQL